MIEYKVGDKVRIIEDEGGDTVGSTVVVSAVYGVNLYYTSVDPKYIGCSFVTTGMSVEKVNE